MYCLNVTPRFGDVDLLGHVNNTVYSAWFELARNPLLKIFDPEIKMDKRTFPLIMAHMDYDFLSPLFFQYEITIKSWVSRIGNKSFNFYHEAWQRNILCAKGNAVIVHYDYNTQKPTPIPGEKKKLLEEHLLDV
jgi:acyl-CoA thioester hydrolase